MSNQEKNETPKLSKEAKEYRKKRDSLVAEIQAQQKDAKNKSVLKSEEALFSYYWALRMEYLINKSHFNHASRTMGKKKRSKQYMALIYKQGCIKAFEYALGLDRPVDEVKPKMELEKTEPTTKPSSTLLDQHGLPINKEAS